MMTNMELLAEDWKYDLREYDKRLTALKAKQAELDDIYSMSEEAACRLYNADNKDEVITAIEEEIAQLYDEVEASQPHDECNRTLDPAFRSWADFAQYKGIC